MRMPGYFTNTLAKLDRCIGRPDAFKSELAMDCRGPPDRLCDDIRTREFWSLVKNVNYKLPASILGMLI